MFFILLVISFVVILFIYIIIKSFIDPQNVTITLQDRKIEKLFTENKYLALDESEINEIYDMLEIEMSANRMKSFVTHGAPGNQYTVIYDNIHGSWGRQE